VFTCTLHNIFDHLDQAQSHAIIGVVDAVNAIRFQFSDFIQRNGAAATAEYLDMPCPAFFELIDHETEILVMTTLVGRDCDRIGILLDGCTNDIQYAAVMA